MTQVFRNLSRALAPRRAWPHALAAVAQATAGCGAQGGGGAVPAPAPASLAADSFSVGSGYRGLAWGTTRDEVKRDHPDAVPGRRDPKVLVRETSLTGKPVIEAFFFGAQGLEEVEIRYLPRLSPQDSAALAMTMDRMFGVHETPLADDSMYQLAWFGLDTEVRLTYDLRESIPYGPVVTYALRKAAPASVTTVRPGGASPASAGGDPGARFGDRVRAARREGLHLVSAEAPSPGRLTLVYGDATRAVEIALAADPQTGALLGEAALNRSPAMGSQRSAEAVLDLELGTANPTRLTAGGKPGLEHVVTLWFGKRFIALDPKAPNILAGASANDPP